MGLNDDVIDMFIIKNMYMLNHSLIQPFSFLSHFQCANRLF